MVMMIVGRMVMMMMMGRARMVMMMMGRTRIMVMAASTNVGEALARCVETIPEAQKTWDFSLIVSLIGTSLI
jgi:hypothetical protein